MRKQVVVSFKQLNQPIVDIIQSQGIPDYISDLLVLLSARLAQFHQL